VFKPVCGIDYGSFDNLRSFCEQDYPDLQVIFGVREADDPVVHVIRRLIETMPGRDIALVINDRVIGANLKISNLVNMYPLAKHDILIIADSDMRVGPDYVSSVVGAFDAPDVGVVTCLYKARSAAGVASTLSSMSINEWFLPSALVAVALQGPQFCFGSTMAVTRKVLERVGGFEQLGSYLADDHMLGMLALRLGYRLRLSSYVVENVVQERNLRALFAHELRWARTIRSIQPWGHAFSFTTYAVPLSMISAMLAWPSYEAMTLAGGLLGLCLLLRCAMHRVARSSLGLTGAWSFWLVPVRDLFGAAVWAASLFGSRVVWRGWALSVGPKGQLTAKGLSSL